MNKNRVLVLPAITIVVIQSISHEERAEASKPGAEAAPAPRVSVTAHPVLTQLPAKLAK